MALQSKRFAAFFLFLTLIVSAETPRTADAILADYAKAAGGLGAIDAVTSRKINGSVSLLGRSELYWQKPDKVLLLADKERTGYDGSAGWVYSKRKRLRRLGKGQHMPLEIDGNPLRYVHMRQLYSEVDSAPQKTVDDVLMDVLVAPNDLAQTIFYFDTRTHLLARVDEKGETSAYFTQTIWFEDYRENDGIQFPYRITHKTTDKGGASEEFRIKSIENNVAINAEVFSKPQSTKMVFGGKR